MVESRCRCLYFLEVGVALMVFLTLQERINEHMFIWVMGGTIVIVSHNRLGGEGWHLNLCVIGHKISQMEGFLFSRISDRFILGRKTTVLHLLCH